MSTKKISQDEIIHRFKNKHGDRYDYSLVEYKNMKTPVDIICEAHGQFKQTPVGHLNSNGCIKCGEKTLSLEDLIIKCNNTHNRVFDYSLVTDKTYKNGSSKIPIICPIHGVFKQNALRHASGQSCIKCSRNNSKTKQTLSEEEVLNIFKNRHGDRYDYSLVEYKNMKTPVDIICKEHGQFKQDPHNHIKFQGCPKCSISGPSKTEFIIKDFLELHKIKYVHGDRNIIHPKELDFFIKDKSIAIECNGVYWHSSKFVEKNYHLDKTNKCISKNIQLLHFWDFEINNKFDIVSSMILSKTNNISNKIYARKCIIKHVSNSVADNFLEYNHLQGKCSASIKLGLYYEDSLVAIMTFGKSRFNKNYKWELIRYCNILNTTVVGGASKLFKHFINNYYDDTGIISYANLRYSNGKLYDNLNFKLNGSSSPSYFYKGKTIISRYQAQKHKLESLLGYENFDKSLTEEHNLKNNGYYRIYDCGNLIYTY